MSEGSIMMLAGSLFCLGKRGFVASSLLFGRLPLFAVSVWYLMVSCWQAVCKSEKEETSGRGLEGILGEGCLAVKLVHQPSWVPLVGKLSCLSTYFYESNWKDLFQWHHFLGHLWAIMTICNSYCRWLENKIWAPSLTACFCHPRGLRLKHRQQITVADVSGVMSDVAAVLYVPPKRQQSCDASTLLLCSSSFNWRSSPVLTDDAQTWNKRWFTSRKLRVAHRRW